jgi:hypothetical protein
MHNVMLYRGQVVMFGNQTHNFRYHKFSVTMPHPLFCLDVFISTHYKNMTFSIKASVVT